MSAFRIRVRNPSGLHARPAAAFVRAAGGFDAEVTVRNVDRDKGPVSARSLIGVMGLGVSSGMEIEVGAEGPQADEALAAIRAAIEAGLGETLAEPGGAPGPDPGG